MADVLVLGGSGAYRFGAESFGKILEKRRIDTPFGLSNPVYRLRHENGFDFFFLSRHGEKDYDVTAPFVNYRANIYSARLLGVRRIIAWTGPGSLKENIKPGDILIPSDVLDLTKTRKSTFFENSGIGFVRQYPVFCPQMREILAETLSALGLSFHGEGVYACTEGPRLETPAEVRALKVLGADVVGMTLVPEVFLAKELEMCYCAICYITNYAEPGHSRIFESGVLFEGMASREEMERVEGTLERFPEILKLFLERMHKVERSCHCGKLLDRYRKKGKIGDNWINWIIGP